MYLQIQKDFKYDHSIWLIELLDILITFSISFDLDMFQSKVLQNHKISNMESNPAEYNKA